MKIIIIGATNVGIELAQYLVAGGHAVTLVDEPSPELEQVGSRIDLRVVEGTPSWPAVLRRAGAENTELLVAVTPNDEINITACSVAGFLFHVPAKIARLRSAAYLQEAEVIFGNEGIPIDHVISPELVSTDSIVDLIDLPGAGAVGSFCEGRILVVSTTCRDGARMLGRTPGELREAGGRGVVVALYRHGKSVPEFDKVRIEEDDEIFFCSERSRALSTLACFHPLSKRSKSVVVAGGSHLAEQLARRLSARYAVKLVEPDLERAGRIAERLHDTKVEIFAANPVSPDFMHEEHLGTADLFIAASSQDDTNIMSSLIMTRLHQVRCMAIIREDNFNEFLARADQEIDLIFSPREAILSALLSHVRQEGVSGMRLFKRGVAAGIELTVQGSRISSRVVGRKLSALALPKGARVGLVMRERKVIIPDEDFILADKDRVVGFIDDTQASMRLVQLFRPRSFWIPKW